MSVAHKNKKKRKEREKTMHPIPSNVKKNLLEVQQKRKMFHRSRLSKLAELGNVTKHM